jgi:hypothetical protein
MQAYSCNLVMSKNQTLTLKNLPFNAGEELQIMITKPLNFSETKRGDALLSALLEFDDNEFILELERNKQQELAMQDRMML